MKYHLGVDLGGTNIKAGVTDQQGKILLKYSVKTNKAGDANVISEQIVGLCHEVCKKAGISMDEIASVGIGIPGTVDAETGMVIYANNLHLDDAPVGKIVSEALGKPVLLNNDASCAAFGEFVSGSGKEYRSIVMVTLGTGVGGGIILNGKPWDGMEGSGGEIGHMVIDAGGEPCTCGRTGCWEAYSSATALVRDTRLAIEQHPESLLSKVLEKTGKMSAKTACDAMRMGDTVAKELVDRYLFYLSEGIANIINIFAPEAVILGGGVCNEGDALLVPLKKLVYQKCYGGNKIRHADIKIAALGNDAGIVGAAMLYNA